MENTIPESDYEVVGQPQKKSHRSFVFFAIILLILVLILIVLVYLVQRQTFVKSKAYSVNDITQTPIPTTKNVDIANSYAFASPLKATTGGEYIRVTVYVLDSQGLGIPDKLVTLGSYPGLTITNGQTLTDDTGMVYFDITASKAGLFLIQPSVEGKDLSQRITITFE